MPTQTAVPKDHPMMKAWQEFCGTDGMKDALRWATALRYDDGREISDIQREEHAKGAMWHAFTAAYEALEQRIRSLNTALHNSVPCEDFQEEERRCIALEDELKLSRDMVAAIKFTVVQTVGGVDHEGFPTSEINYLQRLRILVAKEQQFQQHTKEVEQFLSDMLCTMVDPLADGIADVKKVCDTLLRAAREQRQREHDLRDALATYAVKAKVSPLNKIER